jgi:hypothetical protein
MAKTRTRNHHWKWENRIWFNAMVTGVWQLLKKMAGGNLSIPETNYRTLLMLSSAAESISATIPSRVQSPSATKIVR